MARRTMTLRQFNDFFYRYIEGGPDSLAGIYYSAPEPVRTKLRDLLNELHAFRRGVIGPPTRRQIVSLKRTLRRLGWKSSSDN